MRCVRLRAKLMRIYMQRSGGFAHFPGRRSSVTLDTSELPPSEARRLEALVELAGVFDLDARRAAAPAPLPDARTFEITVDDGERHGVLRVSEPMAGDAVADLLAALSP